MKRGFHWFSVAEWTFLLFLVLMVMGVAANGLHESTVMEAAVKSFLGALDVFAIFLSLAALVVTVFSEAGALAFLALLIVGLMLFRERIGELLVAAAFLLLIVAIVF